MILIPIHRLPNGIDLPLPERASIHAAGMDLRAAIPDKEVWILAPHERLLVPTGLTVAIPEGYEGQIRPRSGLALKCGITVLNSPGTIDSDYRGELKVLLINHGSESFSLKRGERIAQLLVSIVAKWSWKEELSLDFLGDTERGVGGYGSTGLN